MQSHPSAISRRRVLSAAAALAILGTTSATTAACGTTAPPPDLNDLTAALDRARADSRLATDAADRGGPAVSALTEVAAERAAHAEALAAEIVRLTGGAAPTTTTTTSSASASPARPEPAVGDVIGALKASADGAAQSAATLSGYRAGLLGSIAAACTASYSVAMAPFGGDR